MTETEFEEVCPELHAYSKTESNNSSAEFNALVSTCFTLIAST